LLPHYCVPLTELNSWFDPGIQAGRYPESSLPKNVTEKQGDVGVTPTKTPLPLEKMTPSLYQQSGRQNSEKAENRILRIPFHAIPMASPYPSGRRLVVVILTSSESKLKRRRLSIMDIRMPITASRD